MGEGGGCCFRIVVVGMLFLEWAFVRSRNGKCVCSIALTKTMGVESVLSWGCRRASVPVAAFERPKAHLEVWWANLKKGLLEPKKSQASFLEWLI